MAEWQNGRMEEWQDGRIAGWQDGRMEWPFSATVENTGTVLSMHAMGLWEETRHQHLEFMNHVVGAYELTRTEPCTYQSRSQTSFFEPAEVVWWPGWWRCCHFCWSRYSACALLLKVKVSVSLSNWQVEWKSRLVVYIVSRSWPNSRESAELWSKLGRSE